MTNRTIDPIDAHPNILTSVTLLFRTVSEIASIAVFTAGVLVIIGWMANLQALTKPFFSPVSMKANTAIAFVLTGLSIWLIQTKRLSRLTLFISKSCALIAALIGFLTLLEYIFDWNIGIDEAFTSDILNPPMTSNPGRMSPITALNFLLVGITIFLIDVKVHKRLILSNFIAITACVIVLLCLFGYVYDIEPIIRYSRYLTAIALHTVVVFIITFIGILFARPDTGIMTFFVKDSPGSVMGRRIFVVAALSPLLIGIILIPGRLIGLYDINQSAAISEIIVMIIITSVFLHTAFYINKLDDKRKIIEQRNNTILSTAIDGFWVVDIEGNLIQVNAAYSIMSGYTQEELLQMRISDIEFLETPEKTEIHIKNIMETGGDRFESKHRCKDGRIIDVEISVNLIKQENLIFVFVRDRTESKRMENEIRIERDKTKASLREKELLLGEIHHRVKNNMAIIIAIVNMQSFSVTDENQLNMFKEIELRIKSMALIHEKLYRSKDFANVDFKEYISSLSTNLFETYKTVKNNIHFTVDVSDVSLEIDMAVPCGLMINELLTNALKYAFPNARTGQLYMGMHNVEDNDIELVVKDNGIGLPEGLNIRKSETLGWQLILGLAETQLAGQVSIDNSNGLEFKVRFKKWKRTIMGI